MTWECRNMSYKFIYFLIAEEMQHRSAISRVKNTKQQGTIAPSVKWIYTSFLRERQNSAKKIYFSCSASEIYTNFV